MKGEIAVILFLTLTVFGRQIPSVVDQDAADTEECANREIIKAPDEVDDPVVIDGDILVSKEQAAIYYESGWDGLVNSEAWNTNLYKWNKRIPYQISKEIKDPSDSKMRSMHLNIRSSLQEITQRTCLSFEPAGCIDFTYLYFAKGDECYTYLGAPVFGARTVYLGYSCGGGSSRARTPAHEAMHTMGRYHEQTRPDRDTYVTINANSCDDQMKKNNKADTLNIGYDYSSVMHYSRWQCSLSRPDKPSMTYKKWTGNADYVGQRQVLSAKDVEHIKVYYCPSMMMRLVGGRDNSEGRLEVNNEEVWGTVCSHGFDTNDANVVCKYLGRPGVEEVYSAAHIQNIQSAQDSPIWMSDLECTGQEDNPFTCSQKVMKHHTNCDHNQDVAIRCSKAARLIGGNDNSGRLEVYYNG
ncbi:PREDICTED: scavenger receptor cysteine-rich type 1 protein M130-like, partial [Amphimedon queenslandica]|uniref:Metalloendopeptidase n=1 Tax=Amphimedon queenslandica TaxID=400682 RepID=A0AAN0IPS5_AMPQE